MAMSKSKFEGFEDYLPTMAARLGGEGLVTELSLGFRLLMDPAREAITLESLKKGAGMLGLGTLRDDELQGMLKEGDLDGDGILDLMEFCVLMFRLSPELMEESWRCVGEALGDGARDFLWL